MSQLLASGGPLLGMPSYSTIVYPLKLGPTSPSPSPLPSTHLDVIHLQQDGKVGAVVAEAGGRALVHGSHGAASGGPGAP